MVRLICEKRAKVQTSTVLPCQFAETLPVCSASDLPFLRLHNFCISACKPLKRLNLQSFTDILSLLRRWFSTTEVVDLGHSPMVGPRRSVCWILDRRVLGQAGEGARRILDWKAETG